MFRVAARSSSTFIRSMIHCCSRRRRLYRPSVRPRARGPTPRRRARVGARESRERANEYCFNRTEVQTLNGGESSGKAAYLLLSYRSREYRWATAGRRSPPAARRVLRAARRGPKAVVTRGIRVATTPAASVAGRAGSRARAAGRARRRRVRRRAARPTRHPPCAIRREAQTMRRGTCAPARPDTCIDGPALYLGLRDVERVTPSRGRELARAVGAHVPPRARALARAARAVAGAAVRAVGELARLALVVRVGRWVAARSAVLTGGAGRREAGWSPWARMHTL